MGEKLRIMVTWQPVSRVNEHGKDTPSCSRAWSYVWQFCHTSIILHCESVGELSDLPALWNEEIFDQVQITLKCIAPWNIRSPKEICNNASNETSWDQIAVKLAKGEIYRQIAGLLLRHSPHNNLWYKRWVPNRMINDYVKGSKGILYYLCNETRQRLVMVVTGSNDANYVLYWVNVDNDSWPSCNTKC